MGAGEQRPSGPKLLHKKQKWFVSQIFRVRLLSVCVLLYRSRITPRKAYIRLSSVRMSSIIEKDPTEGGRQDVIQFSAVSLKEHYENSF